MNHFFAKNDNARRMKYFLAMQLLGDRVPATHTLSQHFSGLELGNAKKKYMTLVAVLSNMAKQELSKKPGDRDPIVVTLCTKRYFDLEIYTLLKQYVQRMHAAYFKVLERDPAEISTMFSQSGKEFADGIEEMFSILALSPDTKSFYVRNAERAASAAFGGGLPLNIPNSRCHYHFGDLVINALRHPSPTTEAPWGGVCAGVASRAVGGAEGNGEEILPEYVLAISGENHLLCVHMRSDVAVIEHEGGKVNAVKELSMKEGHDLLVQPLDGEFFCKEGPYAIVRSFAELKIQLLDNFLKNQNMCWMSDDLKAQERLEELLDQTHDLFFNGKKAIDDPMEWKLFQIFFYIMHSTDVMVAKKVTSFSAFCRESSDRAGVMNFIRDLVYAKMMGAGDDPMIREQAFINMMGTAIMTKREPVMKARLALAVAAVRLLGELGNEKFVNYKFAGDAKPTRIEVKEHDAQEIPPEGEGDLSASTSSEESAGAAAPS